MKDGSRWQLLLVVTRCHISADFESRGSVSLVSMPNQHLITTCHEEANNLFMKNGDVKKNKKKTKKLSIRLSIRAFTRNLEDEYTSADFAGSMGPLIPHFVYARSYHNFN